MYHRGGGGVAVPDGLLITLEEEQSIKNIFCRERIPMRPYQRIYKHYKGQYYRVLFAHERRTQHSEMQGNEAAMVVYEQLYVTPSKPLGSVWVRPAPLFYGRLPGGRRRFQRVKRVPRRIRRLIDQLDCSHRHNKRCSRE